MPTADPLNKTICDEAYELVVGQNVYGSFSTAFETFEQVDTCTDQTPTADFSFPSPIRWYLYRGAGFPVTVRGDEFIGLQVRLGCTDFRFCAGDIDYSRGDNMVLWDAKQGIDYLLLVYLHPLRETLQDIPPSNNFTLTVETNDSLDTAFGPLTP